MELGDWATWVMIGALVMDTVKQNYQIRDLRQRVDRLELVARPSESATSKTTSTSDCRRNGWQERR